MKIGNYEVNNTVLGGTAGMLTLVLLSLFVSPWFWLLLALVALGAVGFVAWLAYYEKNQSP